MRKRRSELVYTEKSILKISKECRKEEHVQMYNVCKLHAETKNGLRMERLTSPFLCLRTIEHSIYHW